MRWDTHTIYMCIADRLSRDHCLPNTSLLIIVTNLVIDINVFTLLSSALTCIDTASNLVELVRIDNKTAEHIRDKFVQTWLSRYPRPVRCVHDKGGEFIGKEFQWLLELFSIKDVCSTSKNPQSNAICERMHQTVENVLRTLIHGNPPKTMSKAKDIVDDALATAMHAMRSTVATTLGSAPGSLAFARDMFLNVSLANDCTKTGTTRK